MTKFLIKLKSVLWRNITIWFLVLGVIAVMVDIPTTYRQIKLTVLNRLRPEHVHYLVDPFIDNSGYDRGELEKHAFYYRHVLDLFPERADAYGLLGFSLYHLGQAEEAVDAYRQALKIQPSFFWYYHNLGLIHLKAQNYHQAAEMFQGALDADLKMTVNYLVQSRRVYGPVLAAWGGRPQEIIQGQLKDGFHQVYLGLMISEKALGHEQSIYPVASQVLSQFPEEALFYYFAGIGAKAAGDHPRAAQLMQEALKRDPLIVDGWKAMEAIMRNLNQAGAANAMALKAQALAQSGEGKTDLANQLRLFIY